MYFTAKDREILDFVEKTGMWTPPEYKGGYDHVPFTHEQYLELTRKISENCQERVNKENYFTEMVWVFECDRKTYVHSVMCGQGCTNDLFTLDSYNEYLERINEDGCGYTSALDIPIWEAMIDECDFETIKEEEDHVEFDYKTSKFFVLRGFYKDHNNYKKEEYRVPQKLRDAIWKKALNSAGIDVLK